MAERRLLPVAGYRKNRAVMQQEFTTVFTKLVASTVQATRMAFAPDPIASA